MGSVVYAEMPQDTRALLKESKSERRVSFKASRVYTDYEWKPNPSYGEEVTSPSDSRFVDKDPGSLEPSKDFTESVVKHAELSTLAARVAHSVLEGANTKKVDKGENDVSGSISPQIPSPAECYSLLQKFSMTLVTDVSQAIAEEAKVANGSYNAKYRRFQYAEVPSFDLASMVTELVEGNPVEQFIEVIEFRKKLSRVNGAR